MSIKFIYRHDYGLQIEGSDNSEVTEEQARIIAMRDMANALSALNHNFGTFVEEFDAKQFYKRD